MALLFERGSFAKETSGTANATQTVSLVDSGLTPKALILWCTGQTAEGFSAGARCSVGMGSGTALANQRCIAWASDDNVATSNCGDSWGDSVLEILTNGTPTLGVRGRINAFSAGSFQLIYPTNNTTAYLIHYLVLGGGDLTNAVVLEKSSPVVTGNQNDVGFGFDPEFIFVLHGGTSNAPPATGASYHPGIGAAKSSSARWAYGLSGQDAQTMAANFGAVNDLVTNRVINTLSVTAIPAVFTSADFVGFITDGYTLNWTTVQATARRYGVLAVRGGQHAVGAFSKSTGASGSADDITAPGFQPKGVLQATADRLAADGIGGDSELAIGSFDGTREGHGWVEWSDTALNTEANSKIDTAKVISTNTGPSTMKAEADCSFIANGFRNTWSTNNAVATEIAWWAVGDNAVVANPVIPIGRSRTIGESDDSERRVLMGPRFFRVPFFATPPEPASPVVPFTRGQLLEQEVEKVHVFPHFFPLVPFPPPPPPASPLVPFLASPYLWMDDPEVRSYPWDPSERPHFLPLIPYAVTWIDYETFYLFDPAGYGTITLKLEAVLKDGCKARLVDLSDGSTVVIIENAGSTYQRIRSAALTVPGSSREYKMQIGGPPGQLSSCKGGRLIVRTT